MTKLKLYCAWFCPFAQRGWIALVHKGVEFEYIEIDPYNKTKEFLTVNPRGLVPVILHNERTIYESSICIEYIDEAFPTGNALLPKDPMDRAHVRIWSDFISRRLVPPFYQMLQMQEKSKQEEAKTQFLKHLATLTKEMSPEGPYFMGQTFGMVDIMLIPHVMRFYMLHHYRKFEVPKTEEFDRFRQWKTACENHPLASVIPTLAEKESIIDKYRRYAEDFAETEVAEAIRKGGVMP